MFKTIMSREVAFAEISSYLRNAALIYAYTYFQVYNIWTLKNSSTVSGWLSGQRVRLSHCRS